MKNKTNKIFILSIVIINFCFLVSFKSAFAVSPVLNFSDVTNGPSSGLNDGLGEGTIVTIWGNNLGSSQGTSTIAIGGQNPSHIYYWKNADGNLPGGPSDLYTHHQMQEIAFSIPSSLPNGTHNIMVTVNGEVSNSLPFTVRDGNIYHAKVTGSINGDGSFDNPWLSWRLGGAYNHMIAGDILYLHDNTSDIATVKNIVSAKTGTIDNQYAIVTYPNSRYFIQAPESCVDMYNSNSFVVSKIICKAGAFDEPDESSTVDLGTSKGGSGIEGAPNGRIIANEITEIDGKCSSGYSGAIMASCGGSDCDPISNLKVFGNYIHDWGCPQTSHFEHTTYFSVRNNGYTDVSPWEIGWNHLKDNEAKYGLHNYDETYSSEPNSCGSPTGIVKIHDNYVFNQKGPGITVGSRAGAGTVCWDSGGFDIYNNVIIEAGKGPEYTQFHGVETPGVSFKDAGMSLPIRFFNNIVYSSGNGTDGNTAAIWLPATTNSSSVSVEISNNIIFDTRGGMYTGIDENIFENVQGENNLWFSIGGATESSVDSRLTGNIFQNPQLILDINNNLTLQSTSPAIDAGTSISVVAKDLLGISRPQGLAYDIGAYEYVANSAIRADVDQNSTTNSTDAMLTLRNSLGLNMSSTNWQSSTTTGDVNCDNSSNSTDAMLILRYSLGLDMNGTGWCE